MNNMRQSFEGSMVLGLFSVRGSLTEEPAAPTSYGFATRVV